MPIRSSLSEKARYGSGLSVVSKSTVPHWALGDGPYRPASLLRTNNPRRRCGTCRWWRTMRSRSSPRSLTSATSAPVSARTKSCILSRRITLYRFDGLRPYKIVYIVTPYNPLAFRGLFKQIKSPIADLRNLGAGFPTPTRKVDIRLPGKGNSNSHGARPVY